jgi:hypothetical protein
VSDDFTWKPHGSSRRVAMTARLAIVLACAGIGVAAGSFYPVKMVITAFERASPPRATNQDKARTSDVQNAAAEVVPPATVLTSGKASEATTAPPEAPPRVVLLNPGTVEPATKEERSLSAEAATTEPVRPKPPLRNSTARGDRKVLVVVRRRGPPYDTRVLHGRMRDGRLIVEAKGLTVR